MILLQLAIAGVGLVCLCLACGAAGAAEEQRPHVRVRGIYGGVPTQWFEQGETLDDYGVNAIFLGSGAITGERLALLRRHGAHVFAEFNTMHEAAYLKEHPDAAPVGADGEVSPPPDGWQGVCPTHPGYRRARMEAFRAVVTEHDLDGVWLDYHHSHASWEQAVPNLPDTCFCDRCVAQFTREAGMPLPDGPRAEVARRLLSEHRARWVRWRCDLFTDWVREFRAILDEVGRGTTGRRGDGVVTPATKTGEPRLGRGADSGGGRAPGGSRGWRGGDGRLLLGTFHCPWTDTERDGALREKLAIDLKAQAQYVDVFSPMPYHARFGHAADPEWISRQTAWLGRYLGIEGKAGEPHRIWPIVQLSDWGEVVPAAQVETVLEHGTRLPATGVMAFAWGSLAEAAEKVEAMGRFYRAIRP
jgi:hypothetical protein